MSLLHHFTRNLGARIPSAATCNVIPSKCMSTLTSSSRLLKRSIPTFQRLPTCSLITNADKGLSKFLTVEIAYEKENATHVRPEFSNFEVSDNGMQVTLSREYEASKEMVIVEFDVNESTNIDEPGEIDEESDEESTEIVSYPIFNVAIQKASGTILNFKCLYGQARADKYLKEEDDSLAEPNEEPVAPSQFYIDSVSVSKEDHMSIYDAETTKLDPNLYNYLMAMLNERGINEQFSEKLLLLSSAIEQEQYVKLLNDLDAFAKDE